MLLVIKQLYLRITKGKPITLDEALNIEIDIASMYVYWKARNIIFGCNLHQMAAAKKYIALANKVIQDNDQKLTYYYKYYGLKHRKRI
jgi:hypothetical protein